jgi:hypothetical protein
MNHLMLVQNCNPDTAGKGKTIYIQSKKEKKNCFIKLFLFRC